MKKHILNPILVLSLGVSLFAQNIELPDLTTVISGESVKAGADALPDFGDVMEISSDSGNVVPVLPDVEDPSDSDINSVKNGQAEKTIFAEGLIGAGFPSLFTGDFSVFKLSDVSPFKIEFSHDSAVGYGSHSMGDGYSDRATRLYVEKSLEKEKYAVKLAAGYEAFANGLQRHVPGLTSLNQDLYSAGGSFSWKVSEGFSTGINGDFSFYNRYADIAVGDYDSAAVIYMNPEVFALWSIKDFNLGITGAYSFDNDTADVIFGAPSHRGEFGLKAQWSNDIIKAYGFAGAVLGNQLNDNTVLVPFTVGVDAVFPVYFSNRKFGITAEGGLASSANKIAELERKYKFVQLMIMPTETSDWYGRFSVSVPFQESFTGNVVFEYRQTAFDNGHWYPVYSDYGSSIYVFGMSNMQQFISDLSITYHYKIFSITGGWHSNWIDVPVLEPEHQIVLDLNFQSEDSKWGANLKGIWALNDDISAPVINIEGFAKLTSSVRAVLSVEDALKLLTGEERVYAGNYICRGGTVTALLKFFF